MQTESGQAPKVEEPASPSAPTEPLVCKNWNNALFVDGTEFYYKIKVERFSDNMDEDEDSNEYEFYVSCRVKLKYATDTYCGSTVRCELEPKYQKKNEKYKNDLDMIPFEGKWFIDKNGYYLFRNQFSEIVKSYAPGSCSGVKYIKCELGTLAYEYEEFNRVKPIIPLGPGVKVYEEDDDDDNGTTKKTVSRTGTVLCYHNAFMGDDEFIDDICVDDVKGPSSFKKEISGASDYMIKGSLRSRPKQ